MASLKKIIILIFFLNLGFSQNLEITKKKSDTIFFSYNRAIYNKIASDSIKILFKKQFDRYYKVGLYPHIKEKAISLNYNFEDLYYYPIPKFRLYEDAFDYFNCDSNIENFIAFEEYNKYQFSLIRYKDEILDKIAIPNPIFERQRICNPGLGNTVDSQTYESDYLLSFQAYPEYYTDYYNKIIYNKNNNLFFEIYGIFEVLFEIDTKTGLLYANYYGNMMDSEAKKRILANDFIRKYIGEIKIKTLASGNYKEIDKIEWEPPIPCKSTTSNNKKIYLKVNIKD